MLLLESTHAGAPDRPSPQTAGTCPICYHRGWNYVGLFAFHDRSPSHYGWKCQLCGEAHFEDIPANRAPTTHSLVADLITTLDLHSEARAGLSDTASEDDWRKEAVAYGNVNDALARLKTSLSNSP